MKKSTGYYRSKKGTGFTYKNERGKLIQAKAILNWIKGLAVPPAWRDVWISKDKHAYLLATGFDVKKRKQYIYHPDWEIIREERKLSRLKKLGSALPRIRRRIELDLNKKGLTHDRVLAAIVSLIDTTGIRIGHETYTEENGSYGATTLRKKHVIGNRRKTVSFIGKSGVEREVIITDPSLVAIVSECEDTPGLELFKYFDEHGVKHSVSSDEVNEYIQAISGQAITAKDFRTWFGSAAALEKCFELGKCSLVCEKAHMKTIFLHVAKRLGNTPKIACDSYVHESVIEAHSKGALEKSHSKTKWKSPEEKLLLELLTEYEKEL